MNRTKAKTAVIVPTAMFIFSILGLVRDMSRWKVFYSHSITVEAIVTGNERKYSRGGYHYKPILSYTVNGVRYENVRIDDGSVSSGMPADIGTLRYITVDVRDPRKMLRDPNPETLVFAALGFFCGTFAFLIRKKLSEY